MTTKQNQQSMHVTSKLDRNSALLMGSLWDMIKKLQLFQNATSKVIIISKKFNNVTQLLHQPHCLPIYFFRSCIYGTKHFYTQCLLANSFSIPSQAWHQCYAPYHMLKYPHDPHKWYLLPVFNPEEVPNMMNSVFKHLINK